METKQQVAELHELAHRRSDALMVTLWWVKGTLDTYVEVIDLKEQPPTVFEIPVQRGQSPNDVFNHPFRYTGGSHDTGATPEK